MSRPGLERRRQLAARERAQDGSIALPTEVYVVCQDGIPLSASLTELTVRETIAGHAPGGPRPRIYKVPIVELA